MAQVFSLALQTKYIGWNEYLRPLVPSMHKMHLEIQAGTKWGLTIYDVIFELIGNTKSLTI